MEKKKLIIAWLLIASCALFTIFVKIIDVNYIGYTNTPVGFSTINEFVFNLFGVNLLWYYITDWLGIMPILLSISYAIIGPCQLIKRKSFLKVDKELYILACFYIILIGIYIFFETLIINYRPVLIDGFLEASYPSSHTLMAITLCGSSIIINNRLFKNKFSKLINFMSYCIIAITICGRLVSGVHWFTDIIGGLLISFTLLYIFNLVLPKHQQKSTLS